MHPLDITAQPAYPGPQLTGATWWLVAWVYAEDMKYFDAMDNDTIMGNAGDKVIRIRTDTGRKSGSL